MQKKLLRSVKLTEDTIDAIEQVRASSPCSMFDRTCVIEQLTKLGHLTAASWVMKNPKAYSQMVRAYYEEVPTEAEQDTDETLDNTPIE